MPALTINPGSATLDGKAVQQFTVTANGPAKWVTTAGSLFNDAACTSPYVANTFQASVYLKAVNVSDSYTVTATNAAALSASVAVAVTSVAPYAPSWKYSGEYDVKFLEFIPVSGAADRQVRQQGDYKYKNDYTANARQRAEFFEFLAHHQAHYGTKRNFYFDHPDTGTRYLMYYDAMLKEEWDGPNLVGYSTVMRQV